MKRYWPIMGAVGVAATVGLYGYVSRDPLYEEPEEFLEGETENEVELPEELVPYEDSKIEKKNQPKQISPKYDKKEETQRNRPYRPLLPKSSGLEDALEGEEEYPWYYIPPEERGDLTLEELDRYMSEAREANDFKVALSYIKDFQKITESRRIAAGSTNQEAVTAVGNDLTYGIVFDYDEYLTKVIKNCKTHDYNSVYSKVWSMNFFLAAHPNPEMFTNDRYVKRLDLDALIYKGTLALGVVESCPKGEEQAKLITSESSEPRTSLNKVLKKSKKRWKSFSLKSWRLNLIFKEPEL